MSTTNNLNEIIAANAEQMRVFTDTVKYVIQGCKLVDKKSIKHASGVFDSFKMIINTVKEINLLLSTQIFNFQTHSIFKSINEVMNLIKNITLIKFSNPIILKLKLFYLKSIIKTLYNTINSINKDFTNIQNLLENFGAGVIVKQILSFFDEIKNVIDTFKMINLKFIIFAKIKLIFFKSFIKSLFSSLSSMTNDIDISKILSITLITSILRFIINQFDELLSMIKQFLSFKTMFWLWWRGKKYIKRLRKVIKYINRIIDVIGEIKLSINNNVGKIIMDVIKLTIIFYALQSLITLIRIIKIPILFLFKFKVKILISVIRILQKLIFKIISFVQNINNGLSGLKLNKSIKNLKKIKKLFNLIIDIVKTIVIATIAVIVVIPIAIIFLLGLVALKLVIDATIWLVKSIKFVGISVFIKLTLFIMLITILMGIGIVFMVFGLMIPGILKGIMWFVVFLFALVGVVLLIVGFCMLVSLLAPIIPIVMVGMLFTFTLIASLTLMVGMLKLIEILDLDTDKVMENVRCVLDVAKSIISSIFDTVIDTKDERDSKPWYESILKWVGGTIGTLIKAILSVTLLALTFVSIGIILFIATGLRLLQELDLKPTLITQNVNIVIDTALQVINSIFNRTDDKPEDPSRKGFFQQILEFLGFDDMAKIIHAIMAVGFLALTMVSILLISFIATNLRLLQELDLKPTLIAQNIRTVMETANMAINAIFQEDKTQPKESKGVFGSLLDMVLPSSMKKFIKAISSIGFLSVAKLSIGLVADIARDLKSIMELPSMDGIQGKLTQITSTTKIVIDSIFGDKNVGYNDKAFKRYSCFSKIMKDMIEVMNHSQSEFDNTNTLLKNYGDFVTKINDCDLIKLQTTVKLFEQMVKFSQSINGNFEQLAEVLNEKIAPILEELKESVGSVETTVTKPTGVEAEKQGIRNNLVQTGQTNNLSNSEIDAKVDDRYKDNVQQRYGIDEILSKLSSIVDLFQNGDARVRTT